VFNKRLNNNLIPKTLVDFGDIANFPIFIKIEKTPGDIANFSYVRINKFRKMLQVMLLRKASFNVRNYFRRTFYNNNIIIFYKFILSL
jgi:hypothetical protein